MGFSNIFAAALAFSVLLGIFYILYDSLPNEIVELDSQLVEKYDDLSLKAKTDFALDEVVHYSDSDLTTLTLSNNGRLSMSPEMLSFLLDGMYLDETQVSINRTIEDDNTNPGIWDPGESLICNLTYELDPGTHEIKAFYENGIWCTERITVMDPNMTWSISSTDSLDDSIDASGDLTGIGATNDTDFLYLRINLSGPVSDQCTYSWYIDVDRNGSTGIPTKDERTLKCYPSGATQTYENGAGVEYLVSYQAGCLKLYSQGDLAQVMEERSVLDFSTPTNSSIFAKVPLSGLGFSSGQAPILDFYVYTIDTVGRNDFFPDQ